MSLVYLEDTRVERKSRMRNTSQICGHKFHSPVPMPWLPFGRFRRLLDSKKHGGLN